MRDVFLGARCDPLVTRTRINEGHLRTRQSSALESSNQRPQLIRDQPPLAGIESSQELQFSGNPIDL